MKRQIKHAVYQIPSFSHSLKVSQRIRKSAELSRMGKSQSVKEGAIAGELELVSVKYA